ncbi:MAG: carbohydrate binding domain-containing protein [Verrucomicrobia bacterium]|nr:carbohydrate binding domain-containing protein [Verrucomicrobiota bacterium]
MQRLIASLVLVSCGTLFASAAPYPDRFVWIFGWSLGQDSDVAAITQLTETAAQHGINGAVVSFGLDTLCKKSPDYFRRLEAVRQACERNKVELIPAVFSVGYGGAALAHDRNLAEGVPVQDAAFLAQAGEARFVPEATVRLANGGFEEFTGNKLKGFNFHDQPGEISFVDTQVKHSGQASLRLENFTANAHGHGRVMQEIRLRPHRSYRASLWVKTDSLQPASAFQISVLAKNRSLAPRTFKLPATGDWQKLTILFNSLGFDSVRLYAGVWGGKSGKLWLDDWSVEETGPLNVLHRPGTPVAVRSEDGTTTYTEGADYAPLVDPNYSPYRGDRAAPPLKLRPGSRIKDGQRLRVSWFHPMVVHDSQITVCMAEPALYDIFDHEAKLLAERLHPRRVMLNMDEIRMGGTCQACRGRNMAELLGECITKQTQAIHRHSPNAEVLIWSDMLDPNHNAHGDYYLVEGDYSGSWKHVSKDLTIAVWGGAPREKSLRFFAGEGFRTLVACYYDADNLNDVKSWLALARQTPNVRGFMYTPWQKKYDLLPAFGDLLRETR